MPYCMPNAFLDIEETVVSKRDECWSREAFILGDSTDNEYTCIGIYVHILFQFSIGRLL